MALYKEVRQSDGVTTTYHRVLSVTMTTNRQNSIAGRKGRDFDGKRKLFVRQGGTL